MTWKGDIGGKFPERCPVAKLLKKNIMLCCLSVPMVLWFTYLMLFQKTGREGFDEILVIRRESTATKESHVSKS